MINIVNTDKLLDRVTSLYDAISEANKKHSSEVYSRLSSAREDKERFKEYAKEALLEESEEQTSGVFSRELQLHVNTEKYLTKIRSFSIIPELEVEMVNEVPKITLKRELEDKWNPVIHIALSNVSIAIKNWYPKTNAVALVHAMMDEGASSNYILALSEIKSRLLNFNSRKEAYGLASIAFEDDVIKFVSDLENKYVSCRLDDRHDDLRFEDDDVEIPSIPSMHLHSWERRDAKTIYDAKVDESYGRYITVPDSLKVNHDD